MPGSRACVRVPALLVRVWRAGLPGALWCASPFLWPVFLTLLCSDLSGLGLPLPFFFASFLFFCLFFFRCSRPRCLRLSVLSGPGCPWPWLRVFFCTPPIPHAPPVFFPGFPFPALRPPPLPPPFGLSPCPVSSLFFFLAGGFIASFPPHHWVPSCNVVAPCVCFCWCAGVCRLCPAVLLDCPRCLPRLLAVRRCLPCCALRLCPHPPPSPRPLFLLLCGCRSPPVLLCPPGAPSCLLPPWLCAVLFCVRVVSRLLALRRGVVCCPGVVRPVV